MSHFPRDPWGGARLPTSTEPAGADPLAEMLDALRQPGLDDELDGEARSVARLAAAVRAAGNANHRRASVASRRFRISLGAALVGAALTAMSGLAYAGASRRAQGVASNVLGRWASTPPHDGSAADEAPARQPPTIRPAIPDSPATPATRRARTPAGRGRQLGSSDSGDHGKGKTISELAQAAAPGKGRSSPGRERRQATSGTPGAGQKGDHPVGRTSRTT
jgi:hypothetical protein